MPVRSLSAELAEIARNELNEDPNRVEQILVNLKDWISKQPHLRVRTDDQWLVSVLRSCKYRLEIVKQKMDLYYTLHTTAPEMFWSNHSDFKFTEMNQTGVILPLLKSASPTSPKIVIIRWGKHDPKKYKMYDLIAESHAKLLIMYMEDDQAIICGIKIILDLEGVTLAHLAQATPAVLKKILFLWQEASIIRVKESHCINTPPTFEAVYNMGKPFMKDKQLKRNHIHNKDYEAVYKTIPKEILPEEYGGDGNTIQSIIDHWDTKLKEYRQFLVEGLKFGTDESKRPGKPRTAEDMFGVDGSFKELDFD